MRFGKGRPHSGPRGTRLGDLVPVSAISVDRAERLSMDRTIHGSCGGCPHPEKHRVSHVATVPPAPWKTHRRHHHDVPKPPQARAPTGCGHPPSPPDYLQKTPPRRLLASDVGFCARNSALTQPLPKAGSSSKGLPKAPAGRSGEWLQSTASGGRRSHCCGPRDKTQDRGWRAAAPARCPAPAPWESTPRMNHGGRLPFAAIRVAPAMAAAHVPVTQPAAWVHALASPH